MDAAEESALLDAIDVGLIVLDERGTVTYANAAATHLLDAERGALLGRRIEDLPLRILDATGEPLAPETRPWRVALATRTSVRAQVLAVERGAAHDRVWLSVDARMERDADGALRRVLVALTDVSVAERTRRASAELYQSVIRAMSEGVVVHELDGSIRMANPAAERALGLSAEQLAGRLPIDPQWRLVKPDGGPVERDEIPSEITTRTGEPRSNVVLGARRPSGLLVWLSINTDLVRDPETGAGRAVVATFTDVTSEREAQLALERSRSHLQRILDAVPGVVFQYELRSAREHGFVFLSSGVADVLGVPAEAVVADETRAWDRVHPDDRARLQRDLFRLDEPLAVSDTEFRIGGDPQTLRWMRARAVPERIEGGVLFTGFLLDVSESKKLAESLKRAQHRDAMASLAGGIAHNFNNMLAAILPNLELAMADASPASRLALEDAAHAAASAAELVKQMLALGSRREAADPAAPVDLAAIAREALRICRRTFDRSIELRDPAPDVVAPVRAVASDLQQVVLNLVLNARDALERMPAPRIAVDVRLAPGPVPSTLDAGASHVVLSVSDNGAGMSAEVLRQLGEPFFTTKEVGRGTGLGLASAYATIREAGGALRVESQPGAGTTFELRFPLAAEPLQRPDDVRAQPRRALSGRALVVDDEPLVAKVLGRQLTRVGLEVELLDTGDAAIERARRTPALDLAIVDLSLPGTPGHQVIRELRAQLPTLGIIVLSGHVSPSLDLGSADAVLQKPLSSAALIEAVEQVFEVARPRRA